MFVFSSSEEKQNVRCPRCDSDLYIVASSGFGTVLAVDWLPEFVVFN